MKLTFWRNKIHFCVAILCVGAFWLTAAAPTVAAADTIIFEGGNWVVYGAQDTASNARTLRAFVNGQFAGKYSELKIAHRKSDTDIPQVFSIKGSGALRPVLPHGEFGGTFYGTGYWDCQHGFIQNLPLIKLNVILNVDKTLTFAGKARNDSFISRDFSLTLAKPKKANVRARVSYRLKAKRAVCVDAGRQTNHEGFRIARIASMYLSTPVHDSDQARYFNSSNLPICTGLNNQNGFVLSNPTTLGVEALLSLVHTTTSPRATPTLSIQFTSPSPDEITSQGWVSGSSDPNDDNVDFWANWDAAAANYAQGQVVGDFAFLLKATSPGAVACN